MRYTYTHGITKEKNKLLYAAAALVIALMSVLIYISPAIAGHNGAVVTTDVNECEPTTFSATIADPAGTHKVDNMYLVVDTEDGAVQFANIPVDGTAATITVGPFLTGDTTTVSWNVFGGGERSYDQPLWNGYGDPGFSADISAYAASQGGFSWVIAGTDDPNPFVNWNEVEVPGCVPELLHSANGGGHILDEEGSKRKHWDDISFGLDVEHYNIGTEGEAVVQFHNVGNDDVDKTAFHASEFMEFNYFPGLGDCDAAMNFTAMGSWNGDDSSMLIFRAGDNEDSVRVTLYDGNGGMVYDSRDDYGDQSDCVGNARAMLDNGNVKINSFQ